LRLAEASRECSEEELNPERVRTRFITNCGSGNVGKTSRPYPKGVEGAENQ
jgi:hypothetical protein